MNDQRFITVFRTRDPVELQAIEDYLRVHGIAARGIGTRNASLIGAGQHIFVLRIEVPPSQEQSAREAIQAFTSGTAGVAPEDLPDELRGEPGDEAATTSPPVEARPKRLVWTIAATFIVPGGAHWYAARPWSAGVLALGEIGAIVTLVTTSWVRFVAGVVVLGGCLALDLIGGVRAVQRCRQAPAHARDPSPMRQLATAVVALALVVAAAIVVAPRVPEPRPADRPELELLQLEPLRLELKTGP